MAATEDLVNMEEEENVEEEDIIDDVAHEKLLNSIYELDGKTRKKNVIRGLPVGMSNLDFAVHANTELLKIGPDDLKLKKTNVTTQLKKPMTSLETEKARRQIARESMVAEANKWEPIVKEMRLAPQTHYAQREHGIKMYEALKPKPFVPRTPLEKELYAALGKSDDILRPDSDLTEAEEKALKAMSLKEAQARRAELMKHHELLSRMELKAKRLKRIKSKRYRKILRREKSAAEKKELEQLQKTDPEAFLEKMELIERARMEERLTLKHRGGGKFSRLHKAYSKFDDKTRSAVQDMLQKSRELTQRRQDADSSSEDEEEEKGIEKDEDGEEGADSVTESNTKKTQPIQIEENLLKSLSKKAGGWLDGPNTKYVYTNEKSGSTQNSGGMPNQSSSKDKDSEMSSAIENEGDKDENKRSQQSDNASKKVNSQKKAKVDADSDEEEEVMLSQPMSKATNVEVSSGKRPLSEAVAEEGPKKKRKKKGKNKKQPAESDSTSTVDSSAKKPKEVTLQGADDDNDEKEGEEEEEDPMKVTMEELFADEDFVEEFAKEKAEAEEKARPKIEDTKLPGWGSWAGPDYKEDMQRKKKKRQRSKPVVSQKGRDASVWINPNRNEPLMKLQPKKVPFPYRSVQQYEASLRQPVSRGFVRESAFKLLNKPEVVTKQGYIIKPLDKNDYFGEKSVDGAEQGDKNFGINYAKDTAKKGPQKHGKRKSLR